MTLTLRPYQETTADFIFQYAAEHIRGSLLVVIPPGGGKTPIAGHVQRVMAAEQGLRSLAWAHRRELVGQMYDHLVECGVPAPMIGVGMAGDRRENPSAPIQVWSVDTLRHRDKPLADIVVSDEAHRDASDGRRKLRALYPDAFHLGFTGTPIRLDGRGLKDDYEEMYVGAQPSELIADGYIVAPKIYTVPPELLPDLKGVKKRGGDFREDELEQRSNRKALIGGIVDHWQRRAEGRRTIVFPVGIKHSRAIVAKFRAAGVAAEHLDGTTPLAERVRILARLKDGSVPVVSSCGVLSEGVNVPEVKCVVLARATQSLALFIQQCGRPMRPWEGVEPLILDHAGNTIGQKHWTPHMDRPWSLDGAKADTSTRSAPVKACPSCQVIIGAGCKTCPECKADLAGPPPEPAERTGELVEFRPRFSEEEKRSELERLRGFAAARGLHEGWAEKVYQAKFGEAA
jgi:DNA repair protein RadD